MGTGGESIQENAAPLIRWKRWLPLLVVVILSALLWQVDRRLKNAPSPGFALEDAEWVVVMDDAGAVWAGLESTESWRAIRADLGDPTRDILVALRKEFGIRLSPQRWNTWLGDTAVISGTESGWLLVTRPGVLMRAAMRLTPGTFKRTGTDTTTGGEYGFTWREGYLCITNAPSIDVNTTRSVEAVDLRDGLRVSIPDWHDLNATVFAREGLPFEGRIELRVDEVPDGLSLRDEAGNGLLQVNAADPAPVVALLRELIPDWPNLDTTRTVLDTWFEHTPLEWRDDLDESVWSLDGFAAPDFMAIPQIEQAKLNDAASVSTHLLVHPIEQGEFVGFCEPWLGHEYERCVASNGVLQRMSNTASAFESDTTHWVFGTLDEADLRVEIDTHGLIREMGPIAIAASEHGFIEGWNEDDVRERVDMLFRRSRDLGRAVATGVQDDGVVHFVGLLDARDE